MKNKQSDTAELRRAKTGFWKFSGSCHLLLKLLLKLNNIIISHFCFETRHTHGKKMLCSCTLWIRFGDRHLSRSWEPHSCSQTHGESLKAMGVLRVYDGAKVLLTLPWWEVCVCFVETVTQNTSWTYMSACGMFIQPGGDWPWGKFSVLLRTDEHLVHRHND